MNLHHIALSVAKRKPTLSVSSLIVLLCFILCSGLLFTGSVFFFNSRDIMTAQYRDSVEKQLSIYLNGLEGEFETIDNVQKNLLNNSDILFLKNNNIASFNFNITSAANRILAQIETIKLGNSYIKDLSVHFDRLDRTLSTGRITYTELNRDYIRTILGAQGEHIKYYDNALHMASMAYAASPDEADFICCVETTLNRNKIFADLKRFHVSENARSALIFDDFGYVIPSEQGMLDLLGSRDLRNTRRLSIDGASYLVIDYASESLHARYYQLIPEDEVLADVNKLSDWFFFFGGLVSLITVVYCVILYRLIKKPVDVLADAIAKVETGDFSIRLSHRTIREFAHIFSGFNLMTEKLKYLIDNVYAQKILNQKAELRQLQAQINPHFLYNSFFILKKRIASTQYEDAKRFADMLGVYFKYVTKNYADDSCLSEEIDHAKTYTDIQSVRFRDRIAVDWQELPKEFMGLRVPRLILQPILENAFKYGLEDLEFEGVLRIGFTASEEFLLICIEDNSEGYLLHRDEIEMTRKAIRENPQEEEISGLINIHRRLQLFYEDPKYGLDLDQSELGGLRVTLRLPKEPFS